MIIGKFLYPIHPVRCLITGPYDCRESVFLTNLFLNVIIESDKVYIYSPSLHQDLYQRINKSFSNYMLIHITPNILHDEDIDLVIDKVVNKEDFKKLDTGIKTYESIGELKHHQEYEDGGIIALDDLTEKEKKWSSCSSNFRTQSSLKVIYNGNQPRLLWFTKTNYLSYW